MAKGIFITGTDTGVGKTVIASALAMLLKMSGVNVGVMKPVETGCKNRNGNLLPEDGSTLKKYAMVSDDLKDISPCRFKNPLAPMAASIFEKKRVNIKLIKKSFERLRKAHDFIIVEGIGGLLVPISENFFTSDLAKLFEFPLLIVCHPGLGTLNHTFLTARVAANLKLSVKGIVINNYNFETRDLAMMTNIGIIKKILKTEFLIPFPNLKNLHSEKFFAAARKYLKNLAQDL